MTSHIKLPYFRDIPISVTLDLTINHITEVVIFLSMHVLSVNDEARLDKGSRM